MRSPRYAERPTSFSWTRTSTKVRIALGNARTPQLAKRPTQLYSVSTAALWAYDYFLTVGDEVRSHNYNVAGRKLTATFRSVMHGKQRTFSVREHSHFSWVTLTDIVSVFSLFIFVSTYNSRHHTLPDRHLDQISSTAILGVGEFQ